MKRTKRSLKTQKSLNVMRGLIDQGTRLNWPKASAQAKDMRLSKPPKARSKNGK